MQRYICIHGHFYQPPRENPWLEAIETQDSAAPYHDWNERITAECYATNAAARILDGDGRIARIVNNYARISFNFGPTLLSWMERAAPETYAAILAADRESQARFSGHGSAMAQAFHHAILPLANARDKRTEIRWGIADFEHRFGRRPEGMWLPEAAVDLETLDILAEEGLRFAVLSPYQAAQARSIGEAEWADATAGRIDATVAYSQALPSGRSIALFFYDGDVSRAVAFEGLLNRGEALAGRLIGAFAPDQEEPQIVNIATDGETYGHHHRFGEMALAYALHYIEQSGLARLTNYAEFLELHPPRHEVWIAENTSWSCFHGVQRWRSDCGCNTGGQPGWTQAWRAPLREALDWLRDALAPRFEGAAGQLFADPWAARDGYVQVVLDRSPERVEAFLSQHALPGRPIVGDERVTALRLMELQRNALRMYTSCGWFFSEISGIETVQVLQYAGRALQLAHELFGVDLLPQFLDRLRRAPSNLPSYGDGAAIYERFVRGMVVGLPHVAAHHALSSLFSASSPQRELYCYRVERRDERLFEAGRARLMLGSALVSSSITGESAALSYGALHLGDQLLLGGVRAALPPAGYRGMEAEVGAAFARADHAEVIRLLSRHLGQLDYSMRSLFRDEQRRIMGQILADKLARAEQEYGQLYAEHAPLMRFLADLGMPPPPELHTAAAFTLGARLRRALEADEPSAEAVRAILDEAAHVGATLDTAMAAHTLRQTIDRLAARFREQPANMRRLRRFAAAVAAARALPTAPDLWSAQNIYYRALHEAAPQQRAAATAGDQDARRWLAQFASLGELLRFRPEIAPEP